MEIAVADVEHVRDDVPVSVGDRVHLREYLGQLRTRNDGVVEIVVRADARERRVPELARLPQQLALGRGGGAPESWVPRRGAPWLPRMKGPKPSRGSQVVSPRRTATPRWGRPSWTRRRCLVMER